MVSEYNTHNNTSEKTEWLSKGGTTERQRLRRNCVCNSVPARLFRVCGIFVEPSYVLQERWRSIRKAVSLRCQRKSGRIKTSMAK